MKHLCSFIIFVFILFDGILLPAQTPKLVLPLGHRRLVCAVSYSPDGKMLVTAGDNIARVWEVRTGKLITTLNGNTSFVSSAKYSANGKIIATCGDNKVLLWDAHSYELIGTLTGPANKVRGMEFSHDGRILASYAGDNTIKLWDIESMTLRYTLADKCGYIESACFSPDDKKVVVAAYDKSARIWDVQTGALIGKFIAAEDSYTPPLYACFSPDGKNIAVTFKDPFTIIYRINDGKQLLKLEGHNSDVTCAAFNPDGKSIVTTSADHTAKLWDAHNGKLLATMEGHRSKVVNIKFSKDAKSFVTISEDGNGKVWDAKTGTLRCSLTGHKAGLNDVIFSPDGKSIATSSLDLTAKIWNSTNGALIASLENHATSTYKIVMSPTGKMYITLTGDLFPKVWSTETGQLLYTLIGHTKSINTVEFSPDENTILSTSNNDSAIVWDANTGSIRNIIYEKNIKLKCAKYMNQGKNIITWDNYWNGSSEVYFRDANGKIMKTIKAHSREINDILFAENQNIMVTISGDHTAKIWDLKVDTLLYTINDVVKSLSKACISNDGSLLAISADNKAMVFDITKGKIRCSLNGHSQHISTIAFSADNQKLLTSSWDGTARLWNTTDGKSIRVFQGHKQMIMDASFSKDEKRIVTASMDETAVVWDTETGVKLATLAGHSYGETVALFHPNQNFIMTSSLDGSIIRWDANTYQQQSQTFLLDESDYCILVANGYYNCSPNASKLLHYVTNDFKVITFEQLDVRYNRPDKVLEAVGCQDLPLINSYRKAYYKRLKKLSIDSTTFRDGYSLPEADFVNRDQIEYERTKDTLVIKIRGADNEYLIDRFNVWINEVPLFGVRGISMRARNIHRFDTSLTIRLTRGLNKIETSITNVNGTESYRMPLVVKYSPTNFPPAMHYFIGIGIDRFADLRYNLNYSTKDIQDLCAKLKSKYGDQLRIDTLFNQNVTVEKVKALKAKLLQSKENDQVLISYSGHGLLSHDLDYYLSTYPINFEKPEAQGLPYDALENLLDSIPARQKLLLIDACHSGEVDKEELLTINQTAASEGLKGAQLIEYPHEEQLGLKNSFELMQSLFVNVGKNTGTIIISAAAGNQFALESGQWNNGVFTYSILETLDKYPTLKISELKKIVGKRVETLTNGLQKPTFRNETVEVDWVVW